MMAPVLAPDEVLVTVEAVCLAPEDFCSLEKRPPGGAVVGLVTECGDDASACLGARVLVGAVNACGECNVCRHGLVAACSRLKILGEDVDGGCAQKVVTRERWLTRLDERLNVPGPQAALIPGPVLTAYNLYTHADISPGDLVITLGDGPIAKVAASLGTHRGAQVIAAAGEEPAGQIREALAQIDSLDCPQKILLCDASSGLRQAVDFAAPGSVIVAYGQDESISSLDLCARELKILGFRYSHPDLIPEIAALVVKGDLELAPLHQPGQILDASLESASAAFDAGKCLVATPVAG